MQNSAFTIRLPVNIEKDLIIMARLRYCGLQVVQEQEYIQFRFEKQEHLVMFKQDTKGISQGEVEEVFQLMGTKQGQIPQGEQALIKVASSSLPEQTKRTSTEAPMTPQLPPNTNNQIQTLQKPVKQHVEYQALPIKTEEKKEEEKNQIEQNQTKEEVGYVGLTQEENQLNQVDFNGPTVIPEDETMAINVQNKTQAIDERDSKQVQQQTSSLQPVESPPIESPILSQTEKIPEKSAAPEQSQKVVLESAPVSSPQRSPEPQGPTQEVNTSNEYQQLTTSSNVVEPSSTQVIQLESNSAEKEEAAKEVPKEQVKEKIRPKENEQKSRYMGASKYFIIVLSVWLLWMVLY